MKATIRYIIKSKFVHTVSLICLLVIALLAGLAIPNSEYFILNSNTRPLYIGVGLLIFMACQLLSESRKINIYSTDAWWIILIMYTGMSSFWATNSHYAIYGMFTTLLLYLCYKSFENLHIDSDIVKKWIYWTALICILVALTFEFLIVKDSIFKSINRGNQNLKILQSLNRNLHVLGALIVMLLPFVLFHKSRVNNIITPLLLVSSLFITYYSGSAQVTILIFLLCFVYFIPKIISKISLKGIATIAFIGVTALAVYVGTSEDKLPYVIEEFYQQNDRILMLKNSLSLFSESPIIGHGKNNWEIEFGKYGYKNYRTFVSNIYAFTRFKHPHNSISSILSETGIIGAIIYFYLFIVPSLRLFKARKTLSRLEIAAICSLILYLLLGFIYGIVYNFYNNFRGLSILAVMSLAILNRKSNGYALITKSFSRVINCALLIASIFCIQYFHIHHQTTEIFKKLAIQQRKPSGNKNNNEFPITEFNHQSAHNAKEAVTLANHFVLQNNITQGIRILENALVKDPYNIELLNNLTRLVLDQSNPGKAKELSTKSSKLRDNLIETQILLSKSDFLLRKDSSARLVICSHHQKLNSIIQKKKNFTTNKNLVLKRRMRNEYYLTSKMLKELETFEGKYQIKCFR